MGKVDNVASQAILEGSLIRRWQYLGPIMTKQDSTNEQTLNAESLQHRIKSMMMKKSDLPSRFLAGKKGLILGIANERSIAYGCAEVIHILGADLAIAFAREKSEPYVKPLAEQVESTIFMMCDVEMPGHLEAVFERVSEVWGKLDFVLHLIAYAPKEAMHARVTDCPRKGFFAGHDDLLLLLDSNSQARGVPDGKGWFHPHRNLLWFREGNQKLQHHGTREGSA